MKYSIFFLLSLFLLSGCSENKENKMDENSSVVAKEVTYSSDGTMLKGFLAYDANYEGKRPGIIVVHEWWGLNEYARERAEMLAKSRLYCFGN